MILKLSTAWLQLKHEKIRLIVAQLGISFAVVLIFMQLGFRAALFDSAVRFHMSLQGEVFLISPRSTALVRMESFTKRRLDQVLAFNEVEFVSPIYLGFAQWKNPQTRNSWRNIYVIGFDIRDRVFNLPEVQQNIYKLKLPDVVLFDEASRADFGPIASEFRQRGIVTTEVGNGAPGNRKITVLGLFKLGTSFGADGNLITSDLNFIRMFSQRSINLINVGLIKLKPGTNVDATVEKIRRYLPNDVMVLSKKGFVDFEKKYWMSSTAIGFIFDLGVFMGSIVAIVVVYQILYTNVSEHLAEYATLKALGYKQKYLLSVIFQEAVILAVLGYIPGFIISVIMYNSARSSTLLPISMEPIRALFVFILTAFLCFISGAIAVRKLRDADPADIFK